MSTQSDEGKIAQQKFLIKVIREIHGSGELEKTYGSIASKLKAFLEVDRVLIYQLGGQLWDDERASSSSWDKSKLFLPNTLGQIDTDKQKSTLLLSQKLKPCIEIGKEIIELLIPITLQKREWGFIVIYHCSELRYWQEQDSELVQEIAFHLSVAVGRGEIYQEQQKQEQLIGKAVETAIEQYTIINKIRCSLNINIVLNITTQETRKFLKCDRVAVYRFNNEDQGELIAESVAEGWRSLLIQDPEDTNNQKKGEKHPTINFLDNLELNHTHLQKNQKPPANPDDLFRVCDDIYAAGFSQNYLQLLQKYQARAYIIVAIYKDQSLWGLLAAYQNRGPHHWQTTEIDFMVQIGINLGIALQQAELLSQTQQHKQQLQTALATALKEQSDALIKTHQKEQSLELVIDKIRQTLNLNTIFQTAATEVQKLLGVEHITIYQFDPSYGGEFIFESAPGDFVSLVGVTWHDEYLQETQGGRFKDNQHCIIEDVQDDHRFAECYRGMLEGFGVKSVAIVPLFEGSQLWGLLAGFEHTRCRQWQDGDIHLLKRVAHHISVALQQSCHVKQIEEYAQEQGIIVEQERALLEVIDKIRRTLELKTIFQTAVREIRHLLKADRVAIFRFEPNADFALAKPISEDVAPGYISALHVKVEDHCFAKHSGPYYQQGHLFTIDDLDQANILDCHRQILEKFQVKANMVAPLLMGKKLWGLLCIHQCSAPRRWKTQEKGFVTKIATHLSVGIQQSALLKESQKKAKMLERTLKQVQFQKEHLREIANQEKALARVIERIRQSLKLETIFASTTDEIRQMLKCDRVVVYRFWENWGGEFLYESLGKGWKPLVSRDAKGKSLWEDTYLQYAQGGCHRNQEIFSINDVDTAELSFAHREGYKQLQIRALLIVPVFVGEQLWGMLGVYDHQKPRYWPKREIDLVIQVANQLGVAVYQSNLLRKTRKQSKTLQRTVADLNAIVDNLGDGLLVVDVYGTITRYNPSLLSMFGVTSSLIGKQVLDVFPSELSLLLERKELAHQTVVTVEIPLPHHAIGQALASSIIKKEQDTEEEYLGVVILIRDITKEREVERMKRNFLSMVSHELRTPLTSIVGFSALIRDKLNKVIFSQIKNPNKQTSKAINRIQQNLDIVVSEGERLGKLVNDFLDMTKIESGKITLSLVPVKPHTILTWAIASISPLFYESPVELIEDFSEELPSILGDEDRLIQVFVNLISNGLKFTESGSVICSAKADHKNLLISITDTGIGIAENDYNKIFEPFQQVGNILTTKPKGTGLGLSISKQIIEQHGGKIWLTSEVGKGTTFFVSLPVTKNF